MAVLVLDNGAGNAKIGFSTDAEPKYELFFHFCIAHFVPYVTTLLANVYRYIRKSNMGFGDVPWCKQLSFRPQDVSTPGRFASILHP